MADPPTETTGGDQRPVTVLHVAADPGFEAETATALAERGIEVTARTAQTAESALEALDAGRIDCVVTDHDPPNRDGVALLEAVRSRHGDLPVLLYTGVGDEALASEAISAGVTEYVRKDVDGHAASLAAHIDRAVGRGHAKERDTTDAVGRVANAVDQVANPVDRVADAVARIDADWRFTAVDERTLDLVGMERSELLGETIWEAFPGLEGNQFGQTYREVMSSREPRTVEEYFEGLDTWFEADIYPNDDGGLSVYFRDVTDQKERERTLARLAELLAGDRPFEETLGDLLGLGCDQLDVPYGFLTRIDEENGVQTISEARGDHDLLQRGEESDLSESYCRKTIRADGPLAVEDAVAEGWADDPAYETFQLGCYIGATVDLGDDRGGTLCFAGPAEMAVEFSKFDRAFVELVAKWAGAAYNRERSERRLKRQNERLEQLASVVSHDLRNPLNVVGLSLGMARENGDPEAFDRAERAVERMNDLIEDLLTLARSGDGVDDVETVDLETLVVDCWATVETGAASVTVADGVTVRADRSRLRQLLANLFSNAVEHGGGDVTVTVGALESGFYVADDGPGIPADEREEVFRAGYTTNDTGTGFGLSIVHDIASAHGWTATVGESDAGGARFEFRGVDLDRR